MSELHKFDQFSMDRDCTCGWKAEERTTFVDEARHAWQQHINELASKIATEPKLPPSERAELQVSLLNALSDEIRATNKVNVLILDRVRVLTAQGSLNCERLDRIESLYVPQIQEHVGIISAALENIGETQAVQRAALEGIQGLLVDLDAKVDESTEAGETIVNRMITAMEGVESELRNAANPRLMSTVKRLTAIEELLAGMERRRTSKDERSTALENNVATLNKPVLSERSDRVIGKPCKVCAGKRRVHALFERKALENKATTVDEIMAAHDGRKPRKAGKRKRVKR